MKRSRSTRATRDPFLRSKLGLDIRRFGTKRRKPPKGGSEPVTVEPNRPKLGEGGAAAELEFDE